MDDALREELATLGQLLELNRTERDDMVRTIAARLREQQGTVDLAHVARLTTLSPSALNAMLRNDS